jgi:hypothetical protein
MFWKSWRISASNSEFFVSTRRRTPRSVARSFVYCVCTLILRPSL